jgi:hypothetical protein
MLNVVDSVNLKHEILEIKEHIRQIFEVTLNSPIFQDMATVLLIQNDQTIASVKLDILKCVGLLTYGSKIFNPQDSIKSGTQMYSLVNALLQCLSDHHLLSAVLGTL